MLTCSINLVKWINQKNLKYDKCANQQFAMSFSFALFFETRMNASNLVSDLIKDVTSHQVYSSMWCTLADHRSGVQVLNAEDNEEYK